MPRVEEISNSREEKVAAARNYYRFLVDMYLDEADVLEPPGGCWPSTPPNRWERFDKTEEVVALLRELPYLRGTSPDQIHGTLYTVFAKLAEYRWGNSWQIPQRMERAISRPREIGPYRGSYSSGPAVTRHAARYRTRSGLLVRVWMANRELGGDPYDWVDNGVIPEDQLKWRVESGIWPIANLFNMLKGHFQRLDFVPTDSRGVQDV